MTKGQLNYLRMIVTSRGVLDSGTNPTIWSGNTWVVDAKGEVQTLLTNILTNAGLTEADLSGVTEVKELLWHNTAAMGVHMNIGTKVWAENQTPADMILAGEMHYVMSDLDRGAIQDALVKLNFIAGKVALIPLLDLPNVNITSAEITRYNANIVSLTAAAPQFRVQQTLKTTATADIIADFTLLRAAKKKQNNLIQTYKLTQSNFVKAYDLGSKIINLGKGATTEISIILPGKHVAWFHEKYLPGDTLTFRNHSVLAKVKVFLNDSTDVPVTGGFEVNPEKEFKLAIPTDFNSAFGHYIIVVNLSSIDDAQVTGILAKGKSESGAPSPALG